MDCHTAVQHLYELLDHELTPALEAEVREHFETCANCFPLYQFESGFQRFLRTRREAEGAPDALRRRIFDRVMLDEETEPE